MLLIAAGVAYLFMVMADRRHGGLSIRCVVGTAAMTAAAMCAVAPRTSGDLWMYAVYGRMAALHINPWTHAPRRARHRSVAARAGKRWMHMPSMYGPVMVWIERAASPLLGSSSLATRCYYQGMGLAAVGLSATVVWKHTQSASAVAYLALNPVVLVHLVNGGRNDVLVGLAMVVAVVMVTDGHDALPTAIAGGAVLVKLTAGVGVLALVWWLLAHRGLRVAARAAVAAGAVVVVGTALAGRRVAHGAAPPRRSTLLVRVPMDDHRTPAPAAAHPHACARSPSPQPSPSPYWRDTSTAARRLQSPPRSACGPSRCRTCSPDISGGRSRLPPWSAAVVSRPSSRSSRSSS